MYEVELKFPLADPQPVLDRLVAWGAESGGTVEQCDVYFRHPQRDFGQTDEALRVRSAGEFNCVTYKGPVVDSHTKTRREIEVLIADGADAASHFSEILGLLGFQPVRSVRKKRSLWHLVWQNRQFEIAVDDVVDLGPFLEIETQSDEAGRAAASRTVLTLAAGLGLSEPEPTSYLGLLLARDRGKV
ncbi:MAG TPA: class IV adenylate cyclase [Planctomycetaceae bacterium]|nr:class IV adenylate cyclase [Planctomycetaceae bacterium]